MKTIEELREMEEHDLIHEVLKLQHKLKQSTPNESDSSQIHNYHFASNQLLKCGYQKLTGSALIISVYDLKGNVLIKPISISDGFSNATINNMLDDLQRTYDRRIELKPTETRL